MNDRDDDNDLRDDGPELETVDLRLARLSASVAPPAAAWERIEARLEPRAGSGGSGVGSGPRAMLALAASVAAVAVVVLLTRTPEMAAPGVAKTGPAFDNPAIETPVAEAPESEPHRLPAVLPASLGGNEALGTEFIATRTQMVDDFNARLEELDPQSRELVLANMRVIDDALGRIESALTEHPDSELLREMLVSTYQRELAYMGHVTRLPTRSNQRIKL